jgi:hypothetical protein
MSDFLKVYGPILAFIAVGFVVAYQFVDPAPPRSLTLATGSPEGAYHAYGERYREILARDGITVTLVNTAGTASATRRPRPTWRPWRASITSPSGSWCAASGRSRA